MLETITEEEKLRILLARLYTPKENLNRRNGELLDQSDDPHIDFKRDSADDIERKIQDRFTIRMKEMARFKPSA